MIDNENERIGDNDKVTNVTDVENVANDSNENPDKNAKKRSLGREIFSWIVTIAGAVVLAYLITTFVIVNAVVPTGSMLDTIKEQDRLVALRLSYVFGEPERYDIAVFKYPDDENTLYIKRVIGLPGEKVTIKKDDKGDTKIYINDSTEPLRDDFIKEPMELLGKDENGNITYNQELTYNVPEDCYFMLGDNRNNSKDSRFWDSTYYVHKDKILGKALFKYFPSIEWIDNVKE